jgi:hypothetical protein
MEWKMPDKTHSFIPELKQNLNRKRCGSIVKTDSAACVSRAACVVKYIYLIQHTVDGQSGSIVN